jgi:argininosuccinate lyase
MPQKKNPDVPELIRGKSGPVFGNLQSLLVMMKGTPLAYNKDYQEDKAATFAALDNLNACLQAMGIFLANITLHSQAMRNSAQQGHLNATDLADYFVSLGTPFREAHEQAGLVVRIALERGCEIHELPLKLLQDVNPGTTEAVFTALALEVGLHKKQSVGSTHPGLVSEQLEKWCQVIARLIEN